MVARSDSLDLIDRSPKQGARRGESPGVERIGAILERWWAQAELVVEADAEATRPAPRQLVFGPARIAR